MKISKVQSTLDYIYLVPYYVPGENKTSDLNYIIQLVDYNQKNRDCNLMIDSKQVKLVDSNPAIKIIYNNNFMIFV